jgi:hypothetical protein
VLLAFAQVGVFDFGSRSSPLVLLLDRNDDPVTPLLTQWTYQVGGSLTDCPQEDRRAGYKQVATAATLGTYDFVNDSQGPGRQANDTVGAVVQSAALEQSPVVLKPHTSWRRRHSCVHLVFVPASCRLQPCIPHL